MRHEWLSPELAAASAALHAKQTAWREQRQRAVNEFFECHFVGRTITDIETVTPKTPLPDEWWERRAADLLDALLTLDDGTEIVMCGYVLKGS